MTSVYACLNVAPYNKQLVCIFYKYNLCHQLFIYVGINESTVYAQGNTGYRSQVICCSYIVLT